jgi:hypothetical protein
VRCLTWTQQAAHTVRRARIVARLFFQRGTAVSQPRRAAGADRLLLLAIGRRRLWLGVIATQLSLE